jgi:hypothetical protein
MKITNFFKPLAVILCLVFSAAAQDPEPVPTPPVVGEVTITATKANMDPLYVELRKLSEAANAFSGEYATVNNLVLKRDAATFTFKSGEFYFLAPAGGTKRTGAVFIGDGEISLTPPVESERKILQLFVEAPEFREQFTELVVFFTDETFDEIKKSSQVTMASAGPQAGKARDAFRDKENLLRNTFRYNMTTRILMDTYAPPRPGFFYSFINGKKYDKLVFQLDPLGIPQVSPEQVLLRSYDDKDGGIWSAFHLAGEYQKGTARSGQDRRVFDLVSHEIDVTVRGTKLFAADKVKMTVRVPKQRVLPFNLYPSLRVKRVLDEESGEEINIIQESRDRDGGLAIILPKAQEVGKTFTLIFEYEGESALRQAGTGNFILIPRTSWYPNNGGSQFGDRATFDITLRYPKQFTMVGVGELLEPEKIEGDLKIARWSSKNMEMAVAGFNYGDFVRKEVKDEATGYGLEVYVNREVPDELKSYQMQVEQAERRGADTFATVGAISTSTLAQTVLGESQNAVRIFNTFFGKMPFTRIAMTQQPAANFGQAWGSLVYMPYFAFISETQRTQIFGTRGGTSEFWREVGAHEIAHQWWGHAIGWTSYRDQWMSEGFAQLSTSLYIQYVRKDIGKFNDFWEAERQLIVESSPQTMGKKPYTVGPITQGFRLNTAKTGNTYRRLIYPKGAYVLHMLRMLMHDRKTGDTRFSKMMKDFVATHFNKDVSTDDFKAIVEKHITPEMDIDKNGKMDWFFDQWVYGTDVPAYKLEYSIGKEGDKATLNAKITQSGVSDNFAMPVPIYVDSGDGFVSIGTVTLVGNHSFDLNDIQLPKDVKKVTLAAMNDVLATEIKVVKK